MATSNSGTSSSEISKLPRLSDAVTYSSCELDSSEAFRLSHQPFLTSVEYMLRPRYHPNWHPSWLRKDGTERWKFRALFEDQHFPMSPVVLNVVRMKDKTKVVLRITRSDTDELTIAKRLSEPTLLQDPRNHTVPILDIIPIPSDKEKRVFMVMPMLKDSYSPPFHCLSEFVNTFRQLLDGLDFMHSLNITHIDMT
ncbi:uncharacterized protein EV420DRAFT_1071239 [Desarmillaria tabescens]|uniref:Protein kinase domain-containing protein n=1 Tax=Armillaria tabescens TaxID=1929756 RepID=A0AA39JHB3_ARMTA|nr:uncharacterized protein EV420DRAFT_1071239 [Desarmillaria tabescens]KAK0442780.1 hypothetical protein EV420DRAFT_1071239 [Desarmillaria tabescens]